MGWTIAYIWFILLLFTGYPFYDSIGFALAVPCQLVLGWLTFERWYNSRSHCRFKNGKKRLRSDGVPVNMQQREVGCRQCRRIRTIVDYSDGFRYISHLCTYKDGWCFSEASISPSETQEILAYAYEAHNAAVPTVDADNKK